MFSFKCLVSMFISKNYKIEIFQYVDGGQDYMHYIKKADFANP